MVHNLPNYCQAVKTLYKQRQQISPNAQSALSNKPMEIILNYSEPRMQAWVQCGYQYFNQQFKAAKKQATLNTPDIRNFFGQQT